LLGLAFHPDFAINGYFYLNYIGEGDSTHISRFKTYDDNPDMGDPDSELKLISLKQPYPNHNGGHIAFGPDHYLYIGLGDGGSQGDPENRAQNPKTYLGKMLRIDVNQGELYAIPSSNPHINDISWLGEIWALGFRNPWRFSFDRLTNDLWIADVGQDQFEEINLQSAESTGGENYGWRCYEGDVIFNDDHCLETESFVAPVYTYPHNPECSVTGGYVYRGNKSSPFYGRYFFADYCSDKLWTLVNNGGTWTAEDFGEFSGNNFSAFGEDHKGELYIAGLASGTIYKIVTE
jgi:glucose/arabinose dehydrogenase